MNDQKIYNQLKQIAGEPDFADKSNEIVNRFMSDNADVEVVDSILRFMEDNPYVMYGMPGALVHFVERFYKRGYEQLLIDSIHRKPTPHTIWMLNRVINGTNATEGRQGYIYELERAGNHPDIDEATLERINHFLDELR